MEQRFLLLLLFCFSEASGYGAREMQSLCGAPIQRARLQGCAESAARSGKSALSCSVRTASSRNENSAQKGRCTINDATQRGVLSITTEKLTVQDTGEYWCALNDDSHLFQIKEIKLAAFIGLHAQATRAEESRSEGSTLYIQCPYTAQAGYLRGKAWCRTTGGRLQILVETTPQYPYKSQATEGKVTIEDDPMNRTVSITMTNLQAEDSGTYICAYLSYDDRYYSLKEISLNVFKELHKSELDSLSVQCPYSTVRYSTGRKVWCRRDSQNAYNVMRRTDYPSTRCKTKGLADRTLIQDDSQQRTVTITIQKLQAQDTGVYWCAVDRGSDVTRLMEVRLSVAKRTQQYTAKESGNVVVRCPYSTLDYRAVRKAWCKEGLRKPCTVLVSTNWKPSGYLRTGQQGRVTIQDDTEQGIVTITMEKLEAQDSGVYWCALYELSHLFRMVEVTLNISEVSAGTTLPGTAGTNQSTPFGNTPAPSSKVNTSILLSVILSIMFILALIISVTLCIRWRKQQKRKGTRQAEDTYDKPEDISQLDSIERMESPKDDSKDLKYATLNFKSRLSPEDSLYCNVEPIQTHRKPEDENVEYAIIELKPLPTNDKG